MAESMENRRVSVVVPCFNQGHFLEQALESVRSQTLDEWECIVVDDGSTDNTSEVAERFSSLDGRFRYIRQDNGGLSKARNAGIEIASGEWIQLLDADDRIAVDKFERQLGSTGSDSDIIIAEYSCFSELEPDKTWRYARAEPAMGDPAVAFIRDWGPRLCVPIHCMLIRADCFRRWGRFDERLWAAEDWHWHIRVAARGARYAYAPDVLAYYRQNGRGMTGDSIRIRLGQLACLEYIISDLTLSCEHRATVRTRYVTQRRRAVIASFGERRWPLLAKLLFSPVVVATSRRARFVIPWLWLLLSLIAPRLISSDMVKTRDD